MSAPNVSHAAIVFQFADGVIMQAFDPDFSEEQNREIARRIAIEGRRRKREGLPYHGRMRERREGDR